MTRIFEALKKAQVQRPEARAPIQPLRPHGSPLAMGPATGTLDPALTPRPFHGMLRFTPEVTRQMTALRMTLESALQEPGQRTVMLVSAQSGEGTSTVAIQFAGTLAQESGQRVLLMDLNPRHPSPYVESGEIPPGVAGTQAPEPADGAAQCIDVLPAPEGARGGGGLSAPTVREWLEALQGRYDWIVLDGPPVLESPDSAPLAGLADGVLVVIEAGRARRPVLHKATDLLRKARANLVGSVLNRRKLEIPEFLYRRL